MHASSAHRGGAAVAEQATEQIMVAASPQRCYDVAANIESYPEWIDDVKKVTVTERDDHGRPLIAEFRAAAFGRSTTYTLRYDYSEAPHKLSWTLTEGDLTDKLDGTYTFDLAAGGATSITYHLEVALKVPIPGFIKSRAQSRIQGTALRELKTRVEATS